MVIIRTSATEVSIQAASPELGAHAVKVLASQAGGAGVAAEVASCAKEGSTKSSAATPADEEAAGEEPEFPMRGSKGYHHLTPFS